MKKSTLIVVTVCGALAVSGTAFADHKKHNNNQQNSNGSFWKNSGNLGLNHNFGQNSISGMVSTFKKHHKHDDNNQHTVSLDPGIGNGSTPINPLTPPRDPRGDGRVPVTPQGKPGYVWAGDHWERAPAPLSSMTSGPPPVANGGGGVTVSSTNPSLGTFNGMTIRDHRSSSAPGGVIVTPSSTSTRGQSIPTLSGPGPLETLGNGISAVGSGLKDLVTTEVGDPAPNRDHRTTDTSNFGTNVRDHR